MDQLGALVREFLIIDDDAAACLLSLLNVHQVLVRLNRLSYKQASVRLDQHQLKNVYLFVGNPSLIKLLEVACHLLHYVGDCDRICILNNSFVQLADHILDHTELVEQFAASVQHLMREHILLTVHPQVGETFLG